MASSVASSVLRAARPAFRPAAFGAPARQAFRPHGQGFAQRFQQSSRRWQSTDGAQHQTEGWFKRMWESEIGFKTVHFWAPIMKWALVIAGISDFARPIENLSFTQNFALTCTGFIWTRWCLIIKPRNVLLATVNFFLGIVGLVQISRIGFYEYNKKNGVAAVVEEAKEAVKEVKA
ncbi:hypothetical protein B0J13DRAFT_543700 [Dactylonectria estremocensis]|uniref:Mitochondrial pyruvate carrier n=1 Tax=Dactylonectria estremocensis TaxID=1079267 RepID=A0A9P9FCG6_9HYPO|nr:hypothetical protein B0J13DRAFT_543700 [Dactylonectria estremocensis]